MPDEAHDRKQLHIFIDNPNKYVAFLPNNGKINILCTYDAFADCITNNVKIIYTTQLAALSHIFIRIGYDITLYDNDFVINFGEDYLNSIKIGAPSEFHNFYYMQDMYRIGELYQIDE